MAGTFSSSSYEVRFMSPAHKWLANGECKMLGLQCLTLACLDGAMRLGVRHTFMACKVHMVVVGVSELKVQAPS